MASQRKKFPNPHGVGRADQYRAFINGVLDGSIKATELHESRGPNGRIDLEYDELDDERRGQGQAKGLSK